MIMVLHQIHGQQQKSNTPDKAMDKSSNSKIDKESLRYLNTTTWQRMKMDFMEDIKPYIKFIKPIRDMVKPHSDKYGHSFHELFHGFIGPNIKSTVAVLIGYKEPIDLNQNITIDTSAESNDMRESEAMAAISAESNDHGEEVIDLDVIDNAANKLTNGKGQVIDVIVDNVVKEYEKSQDSKQIENQVSNSGKELTPQEIYLRSSFWELMLKQVEDDFRPFLILVPKPIKVFVWRNVYAVSITVGGFVADLLGPTFVSVGIIVTDIGKNFADIGSSMISFSRKLKQKSGAADAKHSNVASKSEASKLLA